ncbi:MAG TPA: LysR family transcriptional regulator, partial [Urbifossiella sp.]|nr:LysR family transcriptional regulator [Urbifossiella sp.]
MPPSISPPTAIPPSLDPATRDLLRAKARQLARRYYLPPDDRDDVEQDLAAHVWARLGRYDPARAGPDAFVRMLAARAAATAVRRRRGATDPLATARRAGDADSIDARAWPGPEAGVDRALDVAAVLAPLPRRLRLTAALVMAGSVAAAGRTLGLSRRAMYRQLAELRARFAAAGLG